MTQLPTPSFEANQHSEQLVDLIKTNITQQNGWISFYDFMHLALYAPNLGYYAAGLQKFGSGGDFTTAPEMTPVFAQTVANQIAEVLAQSQGGVMELGAGTGKLALNILLALAEKDCLPEYYYIVDVSSHLQQVQRETLQAGLPESLFARVKWLTELPNSFDGVIIGNEVLDAIPIHIIQKQNSEIVARGVAIENDTLVWQNQQLTNSEADQALLREVEALNLPDDYTTEVCPAAAGLIASLATTLQKGAIIMIDYGFEAAAYYHAQRSEGTLMCHYQHQAHDNPLTHVGLQDITAHVNFTQIAQAGVDHDLDMAGYTNQATFLVNCGILDVMSQIDPDDIQQYAPMASAVQKLLSPAEMGELFKVIMFTKEIDDEVIGFQSGDKTHTL
jgi:SAM-dependent MidA family methyltransferase